MGAGASSSSAPPPPRFSAETQAAIDKLPEGVKLELQQLHAKVSAQTPRPGTHAALAASTEKDDAPAPAAADTGAAAAGTVKASDKVSECAVRRLDARGCWTWCWTCVL